VADFKRSAKMSAIARSLFWTGFSVAAAALWYAAGVTVALISLTLFLPMFGLLYWLDSRIRRRRTVLIAGVWSRLSIGVWLLFLAIALSLSVHSPQHEAEGMFGALFLLAPAIGSGVSCFLIALWLPCRPRTI
jgi:hypothetical protein